MMKVLSTQGDSIDSICWRYYGNSDMVVTVLQTNPHLAKFDAILPIGTPIDLPDINTQNRQRKSIQLWD